MWGVCVKSGFTVLLLIYVVLLSLFYFFAVNSISILCCFQEINKLVRIIYSRCTYVIVYVNVIMKAVVYRKFRCCFSSADFYRSVKVNVKVLRLRKIHKLRKISRSVIFYIYVNVKVNANFYVYVKFIFHLKFHVDVKFTFIVKFPICLFFKFLCLR